MRRVLAGILALTWTTVVSAQSLDAGPPENVTLAQQEMEEGIAAMAQHAQEEALAHFDKAIALVPSANAPHRYSGEALEELGRWAEAKAAYERYLAIRPGVSDAAAVRERIVRIEGSHLFGTLKVDCRPIGARVFLDGEATATGKSPLILRLASGPHTVLVRGDGYSDFTNTVEILGGRTELIGCTLIQTDASKLLAASGSKPVLRQWWFWTGAGAIVLTAAGFGLWAATHKSVPDSSAGNFRYP